MALTKVIDQGDKMPRFYGVAWYSDWRMPTVVCLPVPLNVIARMVRDAFFYLACPGPMPVNPRSAYWQGRREAAEEAHRAADELAAYRMTRDAERARKPGAKKCS